MGASKMGVQYPKMAIRIDDFGVPPFMETPKYKCPITATQLRPLSRACVWRRNFGKGCMSFRICFSKSCGRCFCWEHPPRSIEASDPSCHPKAAHRHQHLRWLIQWYGSRIGPGSDGPTRLIIFSVRSSKTGAQLF